jgi:hypothetical protein
MPVNPPFLAPLPPSSSCTTEDRSGREPGNLKEKADPALPRVEAYGPLPGEGASLIAVRSLRLRWNGS